MKIIVKTVSGQQYPLECEPEINVATLKQLIQDQHNIQVVTGKLVAKGKILDDGEKKISDYGIVEGASVVAMPTKARPAKKEDAKAEAPKPTVTISSNNASAAAAPNADAAPVQPAQTAPPTTQAAPAQAAPAQASSTALPAGVTSE